MNTSVDSSYTDASSNHHVVNEFADIVPVVSGRIGERETSVVSAKALHKALGVGRDYSTWLSNRIKDYCFEQGVDYEIFDSPVWGNQRSENDRFGVGWVTKRGGDRRSKDYCLSLGMAKELAMVERNEQGRAIRRYFIQCEEALQLTAPEVAARYRRKLKARIGVANLFKPMCSALESVRAEQGKVTQSHHYSNESNMISRIVLGGLTAKQWAGMNGVVGDPRDSMNAEQLEHLSYLESTNITLLDMGMDYPQRKVELTRLSQRWMARRLGS
ncbi:Phage anti-repressor protein [Edwardsiella tarda]|uniref:AntA/AntB antirepressor family protein n=1 Tax=Edwardsiella tarda ATCC 15947 = NBRC 105688 TaxID=667121 RepID=A0AC61TG03_EDWTA|nr:antA/AntB antirepressor family protein [Edwardsiella tarda]UCP99471.1 antA/AntB antirepressor family protein [Edwardsiella tarda ATCC 15947 = NBRC 105688]STD30367.1 Phage anti-repressor protein [Edwardsiella tarda]